MNRALFAVPLALLVSAAVVALPSCAAFGKVVPLIEPAGACIAEALISGGAADPLMIVAECAGTTIEDVIAVIESLLAASPDAGVTPAVVAHRAYLGEMHTKALALKAAGHK